MVTTHPSAFGSLLKRHRMAAGLTQEELAERARLSVRAVSDLERGARRTPYRDTVQALAEALRLGDDERAAFGGAARGRVDETELAVEGPIAAPYPTNLPSAPTSFIGREWEIGALSALLMQPTARLVTLIGPGGIGKTRLALRVAARVLEPGTGAMPYPDGVFFVSLASTRDPAWVPSAIAGALEVKERGGQGLVPALIEHLRARRLLLVLDNFEHLTDARSLLVELLEVCPSLQLLVTSRTVLRLSWEHTFEVSPLGLPDPTGQNAPPRESEAVALFVERAQAVKADFALNPETAPIVAQICSSLDGLPLAIELAAARIRLFPPQALLGRLSQRLQFLTGGAHDVPTRHQTLRGAIDWSHGLLGEEERRLFARLSVFRGGSTLEAVEAVCNSEGDLGGTVLDGVASLVEKSLLRQEGEQEPRFVMLETIREYAAERLKESGSSERLDEEHTRYFLALAEEAAPRMEGPEQGVWLDRLEGERDNLRAALQRARDRGDVDRGLRLALAQCDFWMVRGPLSEGRQWLQDLAAADACAPVERAAALLAAGKLATVEGRRLRSAELFERSLALYREVGDPRGTAEATGRLAGAWYLSGEEERAENLVRQGEIEGRQTGNQALLAASLRLQAAVAAARGDSRQVQNLGEESLALYRAVQDTQGIADALQILASAAYAEGDRQRARAFTDELLALQRRSALDPEREEWLELLAYRARMLGDYAYGTHLLDEVLARAEMVGGRRMAAHARAGLGLMAREQGDYARATALYRESLRALHQVGDLVGRCRALVGLSDVARDQADADRVIELCEEALALLKETGDMALTGFALHNLGLAAWYQGDHGQAERRLNESLNIFGGHRDFQVSDEVFVNSDLTSTMALVELGDFQVAGEVYVSVGLLALDQGQYERAGGIFAECLAIARNTQNRWIMGTLLEGMAGVAAGQGRGARAARLFGAAEALRQAIGAVRWPAHQSLHERSASIARSALGEERFREALEQGRAMSLEESIAEALAESARDRT